MSDRLSDKRGNKNGRAARKPYLSKLDWRPINKDSQTQFKDTTKQGIP